MDTAIFGLFFEALSGICTGFSSATHISLKEKAKRALENRSFHASKGCLALEKQGAILYKGQVIPFPCDPL